MPPRFGFVALEGAAEVEGLREAVHGGAGDFLSLAMAADGVVPDVQPTVGVLPGVFFLVGQVVPGGAEYDGAAEVTLRRRTVVVAPEQKAADLDLDLQAVGILVGSLLQEVDGVLGPLQILRQDVGTDD